MKTNKPIIKLLIKVILILFIINVNYAQVKADELPGAITGKVKDKKNNDFIIGATIKIKGTTIGDASDNDGNFIINQIKPGTYTLVISSISYQTVIIENVEVTNGKATVIEVSMEETTSELKEVVISATKTTSTEVSMLASIRANQVIANGITSQQISKTQDRDASEVIRRMPGITIMNERFVIVRGLSQRYNNVWLNNLAVPSSEADVKSFSFDVIPGSMIDNLLIFKTVSPELPAEFTGGFIKIFTKNIPEKNGFSISYSSSYNSETTFSDFSSYEGGKFDWLGFDDGTRSLPSNTPASLNQYDLSPDNSVREKLNDISKSMNQNWAVSSKRALPDQRFSLGISRKFSIGNFKVGNISALSYGLTQSNYPIDINSYGIYNYTADNPSYTFELKDNQNTQTAKIGLIHNWSFITNNSKIEFRNLLNQMGFSRTTMREGIDWYNDGTVFKSYELKFLSRTTYSGQLTGEHSFSDRKTILDWNLGYAYANKKEPDLKRYRMIRGTQDTTKYYLSFGDTSNPDLSSEARFFLDMNEHIYSGSANLTQKFSLFNSESLFKSGFYAESKSRVFNARNFGYSRSSLQSLFSESTLPVEQIFVPENFNLVTGIKMMEITGKSDSYTGGNDNLAGYFSLKFSPGQRFNVMAGARIEYNVQTLNSYKQGQDIEVNVDRRNFNVNPSINTSFNISSKSLIRFAYGISINRPEFREIAPFYFVDFDLNAGIYGNPDVKQSTIQNIDLRFESYPGSGETFTLAAFYKYFANPIEQVILGSSPIQFSFENVDHSKSYGLEMEIRKMLGKDNFLKNLSLGLNCSYIRSEVNFAPGKLERKRPMQGQSPYIINGGIYYQDQSFTASLLYNTIGKRIIAVGRPSPNKWEDIPDMYELPRHALDFTFSKKIGKYTEVQIGIKNLLNQSIKFIQHVIADVDMSMYSQGEDGMKHFDRVMVTKEFNPGCYFTLGLSFKF
jgi:hypothetical protein